MCQTNRVRGFLLFVVIVVGLATAITGAGFLSVWRAGARARTLLDEGGRLIVGTAEFGQVASLAGRFDGVAQDGCTTASCVFRTQSATRAWPSWAGCHGPNWSSISRLKTASSSSATSRSCPV